ncbi:MAG: YHS domain-containing protein [Candidatus Omnitrophota bacterium]
MSKVFLMLLVLSMLTLYSAGAYAQCGLPGAEGLKEGEVCNTTCPVMGGEVAKDTPFKAEYNGKTIGFCCAGCVEAFNKDPEKYKEKLGLKA